MTNEQIKANLQKLFECKTDFLVIQTGKKSARVNGFYLPGTCEIYLHNKNFETENELMYTAIHELTHHVLTTEKNVKSQKSHSSLFWATFYDFLDRAIELGFYSRNRSKETQNLIQQAKEIQREILEAQIRLGKIIGKLFESCTKNNERIEDVIEHDLQMTGSKAKSLIKMQSGDNSDEISKIINSAKDLNTRAVAQKAADDGKTVDQIKAIAKQKAKATDDGLDSPEWLLREKRRLETQIERLNDRLVQVEETLSSMEGG